MSEGDLIREAADCVVRVGQPAQSDPIMRRLAELPHDQEGRRVVAFLSSRTGAPMDLTFAQNGREVPRPLPAALTTTGQKPWWKLPGGISG